MNKYCYFNYTNLYDKPYEYAINETFLKNFLKIKKIIQLNVLEEINFVMKYQ